MRDGYYKASPSQEYSPRQDDCCVNSFCCFVQRARLVKRVRRLVKRVRCFVKRGRRIARRIRLVKRVRRLVKRVLLVRRVSHGDLFEKVQ